MPPLQNVEFVKIDLPEDECMDSYYNVFHDTVLVAVHRNPDPYWLTIINMNSMKTNSNIIAKGNGPEDMVSCRSYLRDNRMLIIDSDLKKMKIFNLDSIIPWGDSYNPQMYSLGVGEFWSVDVLTDTSFVFYNLWFADNAGIEINKGVPELIVTGSDATNMYVPSQDVPLVATNGANLLTDLNRKKTFITYKGKPQFTLLNSLLDTIKIICGPEPIEMNKYIEDVGNGLKSELFNQYAILPISTENYIFVVNERLHNIPRNVAAETWRKNRPELFKFDWDGNLVARYKIWNCYNIAGFSEVTNTLYVTMFDEDGELCLYKAQL